MKAKITFLIFFFSLVSFGQVGIGNTNPDASALLDVRNATKDKGILVPRVTIDDLSTAAPATSPAESLLVYNDTASPGIPKGFYFWNGTSWEIIGVKRINDLYDGKSDVDGSEDGSSIYLGIGAGLNDDSSDNRNIGIGYNSLKTVVGSNNDGQHNIGIGYNSLKKNTLGNNNTGIGLNTLKENTEGNSNIAIGSFSLSNNTTANNNIAIGNQTLNKNTIGFNNVIIGDWAGRELNNSGNTNDRYNVFIGGRAGDGDDQAEKNVYIGYQAGGGSYTNNVLDAPENKSGNVFIGYRAGYEENGSNKLYIENSAADKDNALIYGEFDNKLFRVNGNIETEGLKVGDNSGTIITEIIKATVTLDLPNIASNTVHKQDFTVTGASPGATVIVSPEKNLSNKLIIASVRVKSNNTVQVKFINLGSSDVDQDSMEWYFTVIE